MISTIFQQKIMHHMDQNASEGLKDNKIYVWSNFNSQVQKRCSSDVNAECEVVFFTWDIRNFL